jgi:hypothetical protein
MFRVYKEAGRPWPVLCPEDDVIDYMVMEAVSLKVRKEDRDAQEEADKQAEVTAWKNEQKNKLKEQFG